MRPALLIASKNRDKVDEIQAILHDLPFKIQTLSDYPDITPPPETGHTFQENALIKARYYYSECGLSVIADDSGLVVPALEGEPGVYSARYAGRDGDYKANNQKLLKKLSGFRVDRRSAYFVCYAVYYDGSEYTESEGRVEGIITEKERGQNGFGYDPIFLYPKLNRTFAEIKTDEKNKISHRKVAFGMLAKKLREKI
jgi:XTP/dITP diphosphohydrolase